jgi:hypothetical protein|tara:strand:+ start:88102 stop:88629 length:528 start_codon:yes stop_codon:yes gene_type:complete
MAVLDVDLLLFFKPIFTWLFVFTIIYAILTKVKFFGESRGVNATISLTMAFLFILTPGVKDVLNIVTPWFIFLFIFIILIVLIFMMVGVPESSIVSTFQEDWFIWTIVIIVLILIFGYAMSQVFGPVIQGLYGTAETAKEGITFDIGRIIFHPRMLGVLFITLVASQAVRLITNK